MRFKHPIYLSLPAVALIFLAGCSSSSSTSENKSDEFKEAEESLRTQIEEVVYNIPSPTEIPYLLQATGAEFNQSLLNPRSKVDQYTSRNDRAALNLGVYAADIGYLASYEKTQEAIDYLNACKTLAENLGVIGAFDMEVLRSVEANIGNRDSLARIVDRTIKKTATFLNDDNRNKLSALVVTGSFIEGLYISTGLIKSYPKDLLPQDKRNLVLTPLMRVVLEQKRSTSELIKLLSSVDQTEPVASIVADLKSLEQNYAALNIEEQIRNNKANLVLTDANLIEITKTVEKLRKDITG